MTDKIEKMTDDDFKKIMQQLGMPESKSLYSALKQVENHTWQAARTVPEASSAIFASRCPMCSYQHGHQIGCENNPIDIALRAAAQEPKK